MKNQSSIRAVFIKLFLVSSLLHLACGEDPEVVDIRIHSESNGLIEERVDDSWVLAEEGVRSVAPQSTLRLRASADDLYRFRAWEVTGADYGKETNLETSEITLTSFTDGAEVLALFEEDEVIDPKERFTLEIVIEGSGSLEVGGLSRDTPFVDDFEEGTELVVDALPDDGWRFDGWSGDIQDESAELLIIMDRDKSIVGVFVEDTATEANTVTFAVADGLEGVAVRVYTDEARLEEERVGETSMTGSDGTVAVELEDGEYWFTATLDGRYDYEGNLEIEGVDELVEIEMIPVEHDAGTGFAGGDGSIDDPFLVGTALQLDNVRYNPDAHFRQIATLDLSAYVDGEGWEPIGGQGSEFSGTYNGDGRTIESLRISRPNSNFVGLFGYTDTASEIFGVSIRALDIEGDEFVGGLVGYAEGMVRNCHVDGRVVGDQSVGGLVGYNMNEVSGSSSFVDVRGESLLGGLVGRNHMHRGKVSNSHSRGSVVAEGGGTAGGLVGFCAGHVMDSYSTATVEGESFVGGLIGYADSGSQTNCYSTGQVDGESFVGGLIGFAGVGSRVGCYWDLDSSRQETSGCESEGRTTLQMKAGIPNVLLDVQGMPDEGGDLMYEDWDEQIWFFGTDEDYPSLPSVPM